MRPLQPVSAGARIGLGVAFFTVFAAAWAAVPLGLAMGAYEPIGAFFEPFVSFARYLPASAFVPLPSLWAGIGELQELPVIVIGSFFQLVPMVAVVVGDTRRDLVEAACTPGATDRSLVARAAARRRARDRRDPAARARLGVDPRDRRRADRLVVRLRAHDHRSQALLATGQIIVIGLIGRVTDFAFKAANRRLFPLGGAAVSGA